MTRCRLLVGVLVVVLGLVVWRVTEYRRTRRFATMTVCFPVVSIGGWAAPTTEQDQTNQTTIRTPRAPNRVVSRKLRFRLLTINVAWVGRQPTIRKTKAGLVSPNRCNKYIEATVRFDQVLDRALASSKGSSLDEFKQGSGNFDIIFWVAPVRLDHLYQISGRHSMAAVFAVMEETRPVPLPPLLLIVAAAAASAIESMVARKADASPLGSCVTGVKKCLTPWLLRNCC
eukprot:SAG11_NODE_909_length_6586_cov_11.216433_4_plen_229_part_00